MATRRKKQYYERGDLFLIPLPDESCGVGQVLAVLPLCTVYAAFGTRLSAPAQRLKRAPDRSALLSVGMTSAASLIFGEWPVVGRAEPDFDVEQYLPLRALARKGYVGATIIDSSILTELVSAYHLLCPWDDFHEPAYLDTLLVPTARRPQNAILIKG